MYKKFTDNNSSLYDDKITLISCNGLSFDRYLAISNLIKNKVAVITDNDIRLRCVCLMIIKNG